MASVDAPSQVLQFLEAAADYVSTSPDSHSRWGLDPADICVLLELGHELAVDAERSNRIYEALQGC